MTDNSIINSGTTVQGLSSGAAALPSGVHIARRIQTLNRMQLSIEECAQGLHSAWVDFQAAKQATDGDVKRLLSAGRIHILSALQSLHLIEEVVQVNREPLIHTYQCLSRCQGYMRKIERISNALLKQDRSPRQALTIEVLIRACPRASYQVENDLGGPIKKARDEIAKMAQPPKSGTA
jgi:hypothetical protein